MKALSACVRSLCDKEKRTRGKVTAMQRVEKVIEIDAPVERVFDLFSDFEHFPRWMRHIRDVHYTGRRYTRWTADAPLGTSVEWEAETTDFDPPYRIAWRSVRGDVDTKGEVIFRETRRGTTIMRVILGYRPPAGRLGALVASLFGTDPEQQLEEDLELFAEVAERRRDARRERSSRSDTPVREARPSRLSNRRRDEDDRERLPRRLRSDARDARRLDFDERWDERLGEPRSRDERDDRDRRAGRHALTPRERERERHERGTDSEYTRDAFRRGVDRLMDDPPSERWRRWD